MRRKISKRAGAVLAAALLALSVAAGSAGAAEPVVVVDTAVLAEQSTPGKAAADYLDQVRVSLQKSLDELQTVWKGRENTDEGRAAIAQGHAVLEQQLSLYRLAASREVNRVMAEAVKAWRAQNKKTRLVLPGAGVLSFDPDVDRTRDVLREMNKLKATFPDMPRVTVQKPKT